VDLAAIPRSFGKQAITGRPYPAAVFDRFLAYAIAHRGVWITTANEVASLA
jgi:hypothetical protein